jgi:acyl-CoA reductase-like NAD-dependent aldehyde dehydrogenase
VYGAKLTCDIIVMVFAVADTVDEAVDLANASEYSLAASLWTGDIFAGQAIASRIRAGKTLRLCTMKVMS